MRQTVALVLMLALAAGCLAASARADGDPASDVLGAQSVFLPQDAAVTPRQQTQLSGLIAEAARDGYSIRVAVIASPTDLGSIAVLWRRPQAYAAFLGEELSLVYHGPLLVVMPVGFGTYHASNSALVRASPTGGLGTAAMTAIRTLAAAAGHPLSLPGGSAAAVGASSTDVLPWLAFALGAILVAAAWIASLRARPPQFRGGSPSSA